jgi:hypothetical protein
MCRKNRRRAARHVEVVGKRRTRRRWCSTRRGVLARHDSMGERVPPAREARNAYAKARSDAELETTRRDRVAEPKEGLESVDFDESDEARCETGTSRHKSTGSRVKIVTESSNAYANARSGAAFACRTREKSTGSRCRPAAESRA